MKVLRKSAARLGYEGSMRYIVVSEYGTDSRYTQRPHYHALFFLDSDFLEILSRNNLDFLSFCSKYWKYGKSSASKKGLYLSSDKGCDYISKYVTKTQELLKLRNFKKFYDYLVSLYEHGFRFPLGAKPKTYFYKILRSAGMTYFVLKSLHFGEKITYRLVEESPNTTELLAKISKGIDVVKYGKTVHLPYPRYNLRKLFYENRSDGSYMLSPLGCDVFVNNALDNFRFAVRSVRKWIDDTANYFNDSDSRFSRKALDLMRDNAIQLVFYERFIRGRYFPNDYYLACGDFLNRAVQLYYNPDWFKSVIESLSENELFDVCSEVLSKDSYNISQLLSMDIENTYQPYGCLQNGEFDFIIDNYYACRQYVDYLKLKEYTRRNADLKYIKDMFNSQKY